MFSGDDILILADIANTYNNGDSGAPALFTYFLTYQENIFAIKLDNFDALTNLTNIKNSRSKKRKFNRSLDRKMQRLENQIGETADLDELQKVLLDFLDDNELDISLYQGTIEDDYINGWDKKIINNNGNLDSEPCN